jgi:hypothetical protein
MKSRRLWPKHLLQRLLAPTAALGVLASIASTDQGWAQAPPTGEDPRDKIIRELLQRMERLENEARDRSAPRPAPAPPEPEPEAEAEPVERFPQLQFHGFSDVEFRLNNRSGEQDTFGLGQLDLFLSSRLSEDVSVLSELVVEAGDDNGFAFEIERLLFQYNVSEHFIIEAGRYHTELGYYNTTYHHGSWLQTAARRPLITEFEDEGGLLPIHNVGLYVHGRIPSGSLGLEYAVQVGNGRNYTADAEPVLNVADDNNDKAVGLTLKARPDWAPSWQAGVTLYHDRLTPDLLPTTRQSILAGHLVYLTPKFEFLGEGLVIRHDSSGGSRAAHATAAYAQVARQFGKFRPYLRYQHQNGSGRDAIFALQGLTGWLHGPSVGVRYDFTDRAAFKIQCDHFQREAARAINELTLQVGYTF